MVFEDSGKMNPPEPPEEISDEKKRTLWVGGISDQVDEETLYELFINAGPLTSIKIPEDRETKRKKPFAFVMFQHEESVAFAADLFRDVKLFNRPLRMQNKDTGVGMGNHRGSHQRSISAPNMMQMHSQYQHQQNMQMQMQQMHPQQQQQMGFNPYGAQGGGMPQFMNFNNQQQQFNNGYDNNQRSRDRDRRHDRHRDHSDSRDRIGRDRSHHRNRDYSGGRDRDRDRDRNYGGRNSWGNSGGGGRHRR